MKCVERQGESGFTLIETIAALVIVAIIVAVAGMGIVNVTNGMLTAKQNAATALKTQVAMMRIEKEFHIITAVSSGSATQLNYTNNKGGSPGSHALSLSGTTIQLDGDMLVDNISSFTLTYADTYNGIFTSTWGPTNKVINLSFTMSGAGGSNSTFIMRVRPVNL
jgi:prepilin-type N-terminal cleavage/methylation domain-containing protein